MVHNTENLPASEHGQQPWLVFLDIDGTLVDDSHHPPVSAVQAIRQARARGHRVYISTGRSRSGISDEILDIGFDGVVSASGGFVEIAGALARTQTMAPADVTYLIELFGHYDLEYTLQAEHRSYASEGLADRMQPLLREQRQLAGSGRSALAHLEQLEQRFVYTGPPPLTGIAKATFIGRDHEVFYALRDAIDPRFLAVTGTIPYLGARGGEVGLRQTNKGDALMHVAAVHGIPPARTMAVGDSANDHEMVREAGVGVAMADAPASLRSVADFITGTVAEGGIKMALERYGLISSV
ncbi:HAD-IIB family hydrolase [Microbacterium sp. YY-01]|uniref:HAD-IIB family hydrolase n=1 Tax=Microbacterium sp. YY-01 TaxID=3421634 RepID=UPI003D18075C